MTAMCERCGEVYELEITTWPVKHKYCDICRQSIKAENNLQSTRKKRADFNSTMVRLKALC